MVVVVASWAPLVSTNVRWGTGAAVAFGTAPRAGARAGGSDGDAGPVVSVAPAASPTAARKAKKTTAAAPARAVRTVAEHRRRLPPGRGPGGRGRPAPPLMLTFICLAP